MAISRMQFLRGRFHEAPPPVRPPWAREENAFVLSCERCDACLRACPTEILAKGPGRFPVVDFTRGECTFCGDCVMACPSGALQTVAFAADDVPWRLGARVLDNCLAHNKVVCRTCAEACVPRAIRFRLAKVSIPQVSLEDCTGCGACMAVCPSQSMIVERIT